MADDGSHEEYEATHRELLGEVEREGERVAIDWAVAAERIRALASQQGTAAAGSDSSEMAVGLDVTLLIRTLRSLPDGAGTDAFVVALTDAQGGIDPPPA